MNRIELKQKARENVRKDKFTIILITLIATAIMSATAVGSFSLPLGWLFNTEFLTVAPATSATVRTSPTASEEKFDIDDFFNDEGEFDAKYYFSNGEQSDEYDFSEPFTNPFAEGNNGGSSQKDREDAFDDYFDEYFKEYYGDDYYDDDYVDVSIGNAGLALVVFLLAGALTAGLLRYHLKVWRGEEGELKDLFSKFNKDFPRITKMYLLQTLYVFLWSLLFVVPGIIMAIAYSQAYYLMLDDPNLSAKEALDLSRDLMKGKKWDYFVMYLSFLGWALLGVLTFGILFLWVNPYLLQTVTGYYNEVIRPARVAAGETAGQASAGGTEAAAEPAEPVPEADAEPAPEPKVAPSGRIIPE